MKTLRSDNQFTLEIIYKNFLSHLGVVYGVFKDGRLIFSNEVPTRYDNQLDFTKNAITTELAGFDGLLLEGTRNTYIRIMKSERKDNEIKIETFSNVFKIDTLEEYLNNEIKGQAREIMAEAVRCGKLKWEYNYIVVDTSKDDDEYYSSPVDLRYVENELVGEVHEYDKENDRFIGSKIY